ncbi:MAG: hypothetical protein L3J98_09005 [Gammaproteobacteria bacterium]|nr:hypothetical protein [Gammaproteobacteria bacterium]MCF6260280.1 hypothetical protein [Gammaproteobacteria bacterium]
MTRRSIFAVLGLIVAVVWGVITYLEVDLQSGGDKMSILQTTDWAAEFKPFSDDVEEMNQIWGEPLPEHLVFIGGLDWPAWGYFYRDSNDPPGVIRGEARDRTHLYSGRYKYTHPEGVPVGEIDFGDFEISGLDGERLILHRRNQPPPVEYFYLEPTDPDRIRRPGQPNPR